MKILLLSVLLNVGPLFTVAPGSDPIPDELRYHIIARTNYFCQQEGFPGGVARLTVVYRAKDDITAVSYLCAGE